DLATSLPDRLRVHALAKLLSVSSKDVMAALAELGITVRSAQSSIDRDTALRVLQVLLPEPESEPAEIDDVTQLGTSETALPPMVSSSAGPRVFNSAAPVFLSPAPQPTIAGDPDLDLDLDPDQEDGADSEETGAGEAEADGTTRRRRRRGRRGRGRGKA